jgi:hypothetical protein
MVSVSLAAWVMEVGVVVGIVVVWVCAREDYMNGLSIYWSGCGWF